VSDPFFSPFVELNIEPEHFREFLEYNREKKLENLMEEAKLEIMDQHIETLLGVKICLLYTSPSPRD